MNKTILIAGGASVASLAAGGTAGYFYAKKRLTDALEARLGLELESSKEFYEKKYSHELDVFKLKSRELERQVDQLKDALVDYEDSGKADISKEELDESDEEELSEEDQKTLEVGRQKARKALVDYGATSTAKVLREQKPDLDGLVKANIFDEHGDEAINKRELFADDPHRPQRPPRDDKGRFLPRQAGADDSDPEPDDGDYAEDPYIITELQYARGKEGYEQESAKYYVIDETIIAADGEVIENDIIGEGNLELFPEEGEGEELPVLYVRNDQKKMDYQIHLSTESLTAVTGFTDDGDPNSMYL